MKPRFSRLSCHPMMRFASPAFTLIEVVVGLALGVLVVGALQSLLVHSYRVADTIQRRTDETARNSWPQELLRQDLLSRPAGDDLILRDSSLQFTTLNALQSPRIASRHAVTVRYRTECTEDNRLRLIRQEWEIGSKPPERGGVVLTDDVTAWEIAVYDGRQWCTAWPSSIPRPAYAVRVHCGGPNDMETHEVIQLVPLAWKHHGN